MPCCAVLWVCGRRSSCDSPVADDGVSRGLQPCAGHRTAHQRQKSDEIEAPVERAMRSAGAVRLRRLTERSPQVMLLIVCVGRGKQCRCCRSRRLPTPACEHLNSLLDSYFSVPAGCVVDGNPAYVCARAVSLTQLLPIRTEPTQKRTLHCQLTRYFLPYFYLRFSQSLLPLLFWLCV